MRINNQNQKGFTLIELMIATAVFSLIMLIVTVSVIYISNIYVRGNIESNTQDAARSVITTVARDIEFNKSGSVIINQNANNWYYCIGNDLYVFNLDKEISNLTGPEYSPHALLVFNNTPCPSPVTAPCFINALSSDSLTVSCGGGSYKATELLGNSMRLGQFNVVPCGTLCTQGSYIITVTVAYGDDTAPGDYGSLHSTPADRSLVDNYNGTSSWGYKYYCDDVSFGGQFCAVSSLTTLVYSRIQ